MKPPKFCQQCGNPLTKGIRNGEPRLVCSDDTCDYVHWNNPIPVVAAIVEHEGHVILVRSIGWPAGWYGLVTGFLEKGEMPDTGVVREVEEEVGLEVLEVNYIGMYPFYRMNQLLITYHVKAEGTVKLDITELEDYKAVPIEKVQPWNAGTGIALRDWLRTKGIERELVSLFKR